MFHVAQVALFLHCLSEGGSIQQWPGVGVCVCVYTNTQTHTHTHKTHKRMDEPVLLTTVYIALLLAVAQYDFSLFTQHSSPSANVVFFLFICVFVLFTPF